MNFLLSMGIGNREKVNEYKAKGLDDRAANLKKEAAVTGDKRLEDKAIEAERKAKTRRAEAEDYREAMGLSVKNQTSPVSAKPKQAKKDDGIPADVITKADGEKVVIWKDSKGLINYRGKDGRIKFDEKNNKWLNVDGTEIKEKQAEAPTEPANSTPPVDVPEEPANSTPPNNAPIAPTNQTPPKDVPEAQTNQTPPKDAPTAPTNQIPPNDVPVESADEKSPVETTVPTPAPTPMLRPAVKPAPHPTPSPRPVAKSAALPTAAAAATIPVVNQKTPAETAAPAPEHKPFTRDVRYILQDINSIVTNPGFRTDEKQTRLNKVYAELKNKVGEQDYNGLMKFEKEYEEGIATKFGYPDNAKLAPRTGVANALIEKYDKL